MVGWFESGLENAPLVAKFNVYTKGENLEPLATYLVRLESFFEKISEGRSSTKGRKLISN